MPSQGHGLRGRLEAVCQQHHLSVEVVADIDGLALLMQAVRSGLGATLQPGATISHLDHQALRGDRRRQPDTQSPQLSGQSV